MNAITVNQVSKSYGQVQALDEVSFCVDKGEVFGLIGPDGAGKTSMFRILCTLLLPDAGTAMVDGFDVVKQMRQVRCRVGYMPGKFSLYQDLTVEENLQFFATLFGTTVEEGYDSIRAIYQQIERFKDVFINHASKTQPHSANCHQRKARYVADKKPPGRLHVTLQPGAITKPDKSVL